VLLLADVTLPFAKQRVKELFPGDESVPADKPELPPIVQTVTNDLCTVVFDAAKTITVIRGRRAREEVSGHLMVDLLGTEVLPGAEAIRLGEAVRRAAIAAKDGDQQIKNGASAKKSNVRKKATKDPNLAARLDELLLQIDTEMERASAELLRAPVELAGLPDPKSILVETRAPAAARAPSCEQEDAPPRTYFHPALTRVDGKKVWCGPAPPGYRGVPCADDEERFWDPAKPPCVPSDLRPQHLFNAKEAAEAMVAAMRVEQFQPSSDGFDSDDPDEEHYEKACSSHKFALRRLLRAFPEVAPCPTSSAAASEHETRPCPCGHGVLAQWPWVVQTGQQGFCNCRKADWELICWRSEWEQAVGRAGVSLKCAWAL
jgi:hypothetical protein